MKILLSSKLMVFGALMIFGCLIFLYSQREMFTQWAYTSEDSGNVIIFTYVLSNTGDLNKPKRAEPSSVARIDEGHRVLSLSFVTPKDWTLVYQEREIPQWKAFNEKIDFREEIRKVEDLSAIVRSYAHSWAFTNQTNEFVYSYSRMEGQDSPNIADQKTFSLMYLLQDGFYRPFKYDSKGNTIFLFESDPQWSQSANHFTEELRIKSNKILSLMTAFEWSYSPMDMLDRRTIEWYMVHSKEKPTIGVNDAKAQSLYQKSLPLSLMFDSIKANDQNLSPFLP